MPLIVGRQLFHKGSSSWDKVLRPRPSCQSCCGVRECEQMNTSYTAHTLLGLRDVLTAKEEY